MLQISLEESLQYNNLKCHCFLNELSCCHNEKHLFLDRYQINSLYVADLVTSLAFSYTSKLLDEMTNLISFQEQPIQKTSIHSS